MIKAKGLRDGRPFILLGIDAKNVQALKEGRPILVKAEECDIGIDIVVHYRETIGELYRELQASAGQLPMPKIGRGHRGVDEP